MRWFRSVVRGARGALIGLCAASMILSGCGGGDDPDAGIEPRETDAVVDDAPTTNPTSEQTHVEWPDRPPDLGTDTDAVVVVGAGTCQMRNEGFTEVEGFGVVTERFICEDVMSDPRVTGTQELVVITKYADDTIGGIWTAEEATLITEEGTWRGVAWGIVDFVGVLPFAEREVPFNYGEAHYIGEGPYEGLEYHWYLTGSNSESGVTGWIRSVED